MSKQSWRGSTLLNPEPPVLVSCGGLEQPNLITIGWTGTICTQPSMVSISVRPERYSHHLIKESGQFAINLPTEQLVRAVDWCGVKSGREVDKFAACGLHAAPVDGAHQLFGGQIDGELPALAQQLMAVPLRAHADGYHAGLCADGTCPADGDKVGLIQPAAGYQYRRLRVQKSAALPTLFAHP